MNQLTPSFEDIGINVRCPNTDCGRTRACRVDQITSVIVADSVVHIAARVHKPRDCTAEDCAEQVFTADYPKSTSTELVEVLVGNGVVVDLASSDE